MVFRFVREPWTWGVSVGCFSYGARFIGCSKPFQGGKDSRELNGRLILYGLWARFDRVRKGSKFIGESEVGFPRGLNGLRKKACLPSQSLRNFPQGLKPR